MSYPQISIKKVACKFSVRDNVSTCGDNAFNHNQWSIITDVLINKLTHKFMAMKKKVAKKAVKKAAPKKVVKKAVKKVAKKAVKKVAKKKVAAKKKK